MINLCKRQRPLLAWQQPVRAEEALARAADRRDEELVRVAERRELLLRRGRDHAPARGVLARLVELRAQRVAQLRLGLEGEEARLEGLERDVRPAQRLRLTWFCHNPPPCTSA